MLIQIVALPGHGKSSVALKIAEMLEEAGAKVRIIGEDEKISEAKKRALLKNFYNLIRKFYSAENEIAIYTTQANRSASKCKRKSQKKST